MGMLPISFGLSSTQHSILDSVIFSWLIHTIFTFLVLLLPPWLAHFSFFSSFLPSVFPIFLPSFHPSFFPLSLFLCFLPSLFPSLHFFFLNFISFYQFLKCCSPLEFLFWALFSLDRIQIHRSFVWTHEVSLEMNLPGICRVCMCVCMCTHTCVYMYVLVYSLSQAKKGTGGDGGGTYCSACSYSVDPLFSVWLLAFTLCQVLYA